MIDKLEAMTERHRELEVLISDPEVMKDMERYRTLLQEHSHLQDVVSEHQKRSKLLADIEDARQLIETEDDAEMQQLARDELASLEQLEAETEVRLRELLIPKDPLDLKNIIMEVRAGTGGEEAALFAADLFRMYSRYSEESGWKIEIMSASPTEIGGFKEIVFSVAGKDVYGDLRYESGAHRVQRVPETESGGRIHTSAVTVAVLPEAEEADVKISPEDLRVDVYRSSGPGGQSVNTTDSAVRITHVPTGLVVTCQDEKSQHKNKAKALRVLRARLYEAEELKRHQERAETRKSQIGTGDRSERIRTYNFPQNRMTDHRINLTLYKLESILQGEIGELIEALKVSAREEALQSEAK